MMFFIITATMVVVGAFILGWLTGYKKSSQAHGWNVPKINQKNDTFRGLRKLTVAARASQFQALFEPSAIERSG